MNIADIIAAHQLALAWGETVDGCACGAFVASEADWAAHVAAEIEKVAPFVVPTCPGDLARVIDNRGTEWVRQVNEADEWTDEWHCEAEDAFWPILVAEYGPLTRDSEASE